MSDDISQRLSAIQNQLAKLQTDYASMAGALYDMFFNTTAKDITLRMYNEDGVLVDVKIPNRAKDSLDKVIRCEGNPNVLEIEASQVGVLCIDTETEDLYYYTTDGWILLWSSTNFASGLDYIQPEGDASSLINLNMKNALKYSALPVVSGGTGSTDLGSGMLKSIPAVVENGVEIEPAKIVVATPGSDYAAVNTFVGSVSFALSTNIPEGFLVLDGATYKVKYYTNLYNYLHEALGTEAYIGEDGELVFDLPYLLDYYPQFVDPAKRAPLDKQSPALPNIKGAWAQEITGINTDNYFTGAVAVAKDSDNRPIQVPGKTSAPGGYYDYAIDFDASKYSSIYQDGIDEVRVKNVALLPIIKY